MTQIPDPAEIQGLDAFKPVVTHRHGYHQDKLGFIIGWLRKHPAATLASGEGKILLDEIDRLLEAVMFLDPLSRCDQPGCVLRKGHTENCSMGTVKNNTPEGTTVNENGANISDSI